MVDTIVDGGMMPEIKLNLGYDKKGIPGTMVGLLGHPVTVVKGLDTLRQQAADACAAGARFRFGKWWNGTTLLVRPLACYSAPICSSSCIPPL